MADTTGQCQMNTCAIAVRDPTLGQPFEYIIIFFAFVGYTVIIFLIGYIFGRRSNRYRVTTEKMTMTPVTYTYVRGATEPRFDYLPQLGGAWP